MSKTKILLNGIIKENPTFVLLLGMCPTLGTTTSAIGGLGMGLSTLFVLICSNVAISMVKNFIPDKVRIPAFIVIIATFVTILQLCMQAYLPDLYETLGLFIPSAESMRLETPRKGQIPKNWDRTILFTNMAVTNIEI